MTYEMTSFCCISFHFFFNVVQPDNGGFTPIDLAKSNEQEAVVNHLRPALKAAPPVEARPRKKVHISLLRIVVVIIIRCSLMLSSFSGVVPAHAFHESQQGDRTVEASTRHQWKQRS